MKPIAIHSQCITDNDLGKLHTIFGDRFATFWSEVDRQSHPYLFSDPDHSIGLTTLDWLEENGFEVIYKSADFLPYVENQVKLREEREYAELVTLYEKFLDNSAKENMINWNLETFKKAHPSLFRSIIKAMHEIKK